MRPLTHVRTAVALLFHVLLLHVSVLGGGMACASARADVAGTAAAPQDGGAHHGAHHDAAASVDASVNAPADAPAGTPAPHHGGVPTHCATAAGCAAVAVAGPELTLASLASVESSAERGRVSLPASTHPAPEPPPPRA